MCGLCHLVSVRDMLTGMWRVNLVFPPRGDFCESYFFCPSTGVTQILLVGSLGISGSGSLSLLGIVAEGSLTLLS